MDTHGKRIILASNSPRRKELLAALDIDFTVDTGTSFVETYSPDTPHERAPEPTSRGKSLGFHRELDSDEILVTSDTMVLCGKEILGKYADPRFENPEAFDFRLKPSSPAFALGFKPWDSSKAGASGRQ